MRGKFTASTAMVLLTGVLFLAAATQVFAGGGREEVDEIDISIAVLKGPSGFAAAGMLDKNYQPGFGVNAEYVVLSSPMEAVAKMTSGEVDAAFLPVNTAAKLYTKGPGFRMASVSGLGSLYLIARDGDLPRDWPELKGRTIYLTGKGATPDYVLRYILASAGLDPENDVKLDFSATTPQIAQLLIAGKADTAFIPQPFVMMAESKSSVSIALDPQKELMELRGNDTAFPFTAFVVSPRLADERPEAAAALAQALEASISWTLSEPAAAAAAIEKAGIMSASVAESAIPLCGIEYISASDSRRLVEDFLLMLLEMDPVSVGDRLPDDGFYF